MGTPVLFVNRFSVTDTDNNVAMTIGQRLKQVRKERHLTQVELAARVGMKQSTLSDLELGKSAGTTNLAVVANVLGVNALWLETGRGAMAATGDIGGGSADSPALTKEELRVLAIFRQANRSHPTAKAVIDDALTIAQGLLDEAFLQQKQG